MAGIHPRETDEAAPANCGTEEAETAEDRKNRKESYEPSVVDHCQGDQHQVRASITTADTVRINQD